MLNADSSEVRQGLFAARVATSLLFFLNGVMLATWATRIPAVQAALHLSSGQLGIALLGMAIGAMIAMNIADKHRTRCQR